MSSDRDTNLWVFLAIAFPIAMLLKYIFDCAVTRFILIVLLILFIFYYARMTVGIAWEILQKIIDCFR